MLLHFCVIDFLANTQQEGKKRKESVHWLTGILNAGEKRAEASRRQLVRLVVPAVLGETSDRRPTCDNVNAPSSNVF